MLNTHITLRLPDHERADLDRAASNRGVSWSDMIRLALRYGLPVVTANHSFNVNRVLLILEQLSASMDLIIMREHPHYGEKIIDIAHERVEAHHLVRSWFDQTAAGERKCPLSGCDPEHGK